MIDIHCHILPDVDDGAKEIDESIKMAQIAEENGISKIVATPHYIEEGNYPSKYEINKKVEKLNAILTENDIGVEILPGNEVYITHNLPYLLTNEIINTINGTQYLLMEFPMFEIPGYAEEVIYELKLMGITPIIAHPERYRGVIEDPSILLKYIDMGALCQANSGSITGKFGKNVKTTVMKLIDHNMIHFVGSDGHSPRGRAPKLLKAYNIVQKDYGSGKAEILFKENPEKIIKGEILEPERPLEIKGKRNLKKFFKFLKVSSNKI